MRLLAPFLAAFATLLFVLAAPTPAPAPTPTAAPTPTEPEATRILVVGDSVTHGEDGQYTWRFFAHRGLVSGGANVDFVGPWKGTFPGGETKDHWSGSYADPDFDADHASRWGLSMWEGLYVASEKAPAIEDLVAEHEPDVVVELLGINDFVWLELDAKQMLGQVRLFVERARSAKPDIDFVLGTIPQTWLSKEIPAYNKGLRSLATELSTPWSRVVVTATPAFREGRDTYDNAHLSNRGQVKMARVVLDALNGLGIGGKVKVTMPPKNPRSPKATRPKPRVVKVSWRRAARAARYDVNCGARSTSTTRTSVRVRRVPPRVKTCQVRSVNDIDTGEWSTVRVRH